MWGPAASSPESHRLGRYAMTTTSSTAVVVYDPGLVDPQHVALAGFLGGYRGLTRDAYALDLRQFVAFRDLGLFEVRRSDIETFGRELEPALVSWACGQRQAHPATFWDGVGDDLSSQHIMAAGGMRERPNRTVSKTVVSIGHRGFKSHSLRPGVLPEVRPPRLRSPWSGGPSGSRPGAVVVSVGPGMQL
jgi:hypothetical protein